MDELDSIVEINIENCFASLSQTFLAVSSAAKRLALSVAVCCLRLDGSGRSRIQFLDDEKISENERREIDEVGNFILNIVARSSMRERSTSNFLTQCKLSLSA